MIKAAKGGQIGINGEFYKGGRFLPESIFCDQWMNGCKKAIAKTAALVKFAKKANCGVIFQKDGKFYAISFGTDNARDAYNRISAKLQRREISGFEWFFAGTVQKAGSEF